MNILQQRGSSFVQKEWRRTVALGDVFIVRNRCTLGCCEAPTHSFVMYPFISVLSVQLNQPLTDVQCTCFNKKKKERKEKLHIYDSFIYLFESFTSSGLLLSCWTLPESPCKDSKTSEHLLVCAMVFIFPVWSAGQVGDCVYRRQIWHRGVVNNVASSSRRLHL